jgi:alpha-beta hydrolase superfamily lysophospholipase
LEGWIAISSHRPTVATVVVVHGLGEHSGRYRELATLLADRGIATLAYDQQGHGDSPGRRGAPRSYDSMLEDVDAALKKMVQHAPDVPRFLFGHSMGGNLAVSYTLRYQHDLAGLLLASPMLLPSNPPKRDQIFAAWLTGKILPFIRLSSPVDPDQLTHDPQEIERLRTDPKMHAKISLHLGTQLLAQGRYGLDKAPELEIPTLVLHGAEDSLTDASASHAFALRVGEQAKFKQFDRMYHDILHESDRKLVFDEIGNWFDDRLTAD